MSLFARERCFQPQFNYAFNIFKADKTGCQAEHIRIIVRPAKFNNFIGVMAGATMSIPPPPGHSRAVKNSAAHTLNAVSGYGFALPAAALNYTPLATTAGHGLGSLENV